MAEQIFEFKTAAMTALFPPHNSKAEHFRGVSSKDNFKKGR